MTCDRPPLARIVSDHAVLRFLERAHDVDVELIRHEIAAAIRGLERFDVAIGHVRFVLERGCIVTTIVDPRRGAPRRARRRGR